ncbi:carbohydrate ABC transporter permease [Tessaracoccus oleiagri]|uniref:Multiple sugar transport system permease protein n=1 Tax=Tessaracoccus oleiagri TaxID=686624 RepID=A0A1G9HKS0_9ACTN|nr:carbohydrate ABC transporter permease [Tessaracoccus oleiagri]SDL13578.1 multiple sugar transport system permease protein [Tessaracoccus oleiagri]
MRGEDGRRASVPVEAALLAAIAIIVIPIAWGTMLAFQPNRAIVNPDWDFSMWLGNFESLFAPGEPFLNQLLNSVLITVGTVVLCLVIGSAAGYALSKLNPPRWITLPALVLAAFIPMVPPMTLVPGMYLQMGALGLLNTIGGLVLLNTVLNLPFAALLMKSYFDGVPDELREAALVDGASEVRAFFRVVLPIVRPGMAAVAIFTAIMAWNEFLIGLTMTAGGRTAPLTVGIASLVQPYEVTWGQMAAAGAVAAVPIIVLAIIANRQIVAGLTTGAVKG